MIGSSEPTEPPVLEVRYLGNDPLRRLRDEPTKRDEIIKSMRKLDSEGGELELDANNIDKEETGLLLEYYLGKDILDQVRIVMSGRGVELRYGLEQSLYMAFELMACDLVPIQGLPEAKRTGNDEVFNFPDNRRIRALIGFDNFYKLQDQAREHKVNNTAAFKAMIKGMIDRMVL